MASISFVCANAIALLLQYSKSSPLRRKDDLVLLFCASFSIPYTITGIPTPQGLILKCFDEDKTLIVSDH